MQASTDGGNIHFGGLASGLKTDEIVPAIVDKSRGPLRKVEQHQEILGSHQDLLETLHGVVTTLGDSAHSLDSVHKFVIQRAQSSNDDVVNATAGEGAAHGSYRLDIDKLAKAQLTWSRSLDDADSPAGIAAGTLAWDYAGERQQLNVGEGTSLRALAQAINHKDRGMLARVVYDGKQYRLQLEGKFTGSDGALNLEEENLGLDLALPDSTVRQASDAAFRINSNLAMTRPNNVVHDAIDGVTLVLEQEDAAALVRIAPDPEAMLDAVATFVEAYNTTLDAVDLASKPTRELERGRMVGDATLRNMHAALQEAVTSPVAKIAGPWNSISQIGIASSKDGRLRVDVNKLRDAIRQHPMDVAKLFARDRVAGSHGVAVATQKVVDHYTMPLTGVLPGKIQSITRQRTANDQRIVQMQSHLEKYEGHLRDQFSNLERNMAKMKSQKDFMELQMKSMSNNR